MDTLLHLIERFAEHELFAYALAGLGIGLWWFVRSVRRAGRRLAGTDQQDQEDVERPRRRLPLY